MKLSKYAKINNLTYKSAYNHWLKGIIKGKQLATGTIVVEEENKSSIEQKVVIYSRVSSSENKDNLDRQAERLLSYCNAKGYKVDKIVKEIGSGLNDNRVKLEQILSDNSVNLIVVEHSDRFARFGLNYIKLLLKLQNRDIEIVNPSMNEKEDLMQDFVSIITSFCARLYGQRRNKRKTEKLISELKNI
jgi:putative resolvase